LLLNPPMYGLLKLMMPSLAFLDRMAVSFFCVLAVMGIITMIKPLKEPKVMPIKTDINLESSGIAKVLGLVVVALTVALYIFFW
jgi:solute:Na+ symporter, SSS family